MSQGKTLLVGTAWVALGQGIGFFLRIFSSWALAKMLAPDDYGRLGWAMAIVTWFELTSDLGLVPTLLRSKDGLTPRYLQTAWTMTMMRGSLLGVACLFVALATGTLWGYTTHGILLALLGLRPMIMALRSPGIVKRRARLDFRAIVIEEILQTGIGVYSSVIWATFDPSANAIVAGTLIGTMTSVVVSYWLEPMMPVWTWDKEVMAELGQSSKKIFLNTMVMALWLNMDRLIGPEWVGDAGMGPYVLAFNLAAAVEGLLSKALDVHYGQLAKKMASMGHADELDELHEKAGQWKRLYVFPAIVVISAVAPAAVWILYDARYATARIILPVLILRLIPRLHGQFHFQRMLAKGQLAPATIAYLIAALVQIAVMRPLCKLDPYEYTWGGARGLALSVMISTVVWTLCQDFLAGRVTAKARWEWTHFIFWTGSGMTVASFF
jgi:O-antigen/teichoic acid export membrane protein